MTRNTRAIRSMIRITSRRESAKFAEQAVAAQGEVMAPLIDVLTDIKFTRGSLKSDQCFVDWRGIPDKHGLYLIVNGIISKYIEKLSKKQAELLWPPRNGLNRLMWGINGIRISQQAIDAAKQKRPVLLHRYWWGLELEDHGVDYMARVAVVENPGVQNNTSIAQVRTLIRTQHPITLLIEGHGSSFTVELPAGAIVKVLRKE